jgi:hypothetical protein
MHVQASTSRAKTKEVHEEENKEYGHLGTYGNIKSKILSHLVKGKISLTPMETILIIHGELEYLEGLMKLARNKNDVEATHTEVVIVMDTPRIKRICIDKVHHNKNFHLVVEINRTLIESLVSTGASMSVTPANVVRKFNIMHLVSSHETYKITSGIIIQALGRITDIPVTVGKVVCQMIFLVINNHNYDLLLGLDFLMKIGVVVNVENGVIQVRNRPGIVVEIPPLNVVNMFHRIPELEVLGHDQIRKDLNKMSLG